MNKKWVSEVVTIKEIESWKDNSIITISAGTGSGKSYFIKNILYAIAKRDNKRILMLIHRNNCVNQFQMEIERDSKTDVIDIKTYQSIESVRKRGGIYNLEQYDYIVCDEFHYFMSDASFNQFTDLSLDAILDNKNAIRIFTSATGSNMKHYLNDHKHKNLKTINYSVKSDYKHVNKLQFFYKDETIEDYVKTAIDTKTKTMFFIQSASKAFALYDKYREHSMFNCGKSGKYYKHVDKQKVEDMLKNEKFDDLILFTTTVMDAGVNIVDNNLHHIVVDVKDTDTMIQCIGRKRLNGKDDHVNLYLKAVSNQQLGGIETHENNKMKTAEYFIVHGQRMLVKNNYRVLHDKFVYEELTDTGIELKLNKLMYFKSLTNILEIHRIKKYYGKHSYCRYLTEEVFRHNHFTVLEITKEVADMKDYLESMVGEVMLKPSDRAELIEMINVRDGRNNKLLKSIETLNGAIKENGLDYTIEQFSISKMIEGKRKRYNFAWKIRRLSDC